MNFSMALKYSISSQTLAINVHDNCFHAGEQKNNILILTLKEELVTERSDFNYIIKNKKGKKIVLLTAWSLPT